MTHSKEVLDVLIERRVAHLRLLAARTACEYWKQHRLDHREKSFAERVEEALARARRRGGTDHDMV